MKKVLWLVAMVALIVVGLNPDSVGFPLNIIVAVLFAYLIFSSGKRMLGGLSQPLPEPPPAGELRKVKLEYRCEICGSEARMTVAPDEDPDPPRHCMDEMTLVVPIDD